MLRTDLGSLHATNHVVVSFSGPVSNPSISHLVAPLISHFLLPDYIPGVNKNPPKKPQWRIGLRGTVKDWETALTPQTRKHSAAHMGRKSTTWQTASQITYISVWRTLCLPGRYSVFPTTNPGWTPGSKTLPLCSCVDSKSTYFAYWWRHRPTSQPLAFDLLTPCCLITTNNDGLHACVCAAEDIEPIRVTRTKLCSSDTTLSEKRKTN